MADATHVVSGKGSSAKKAVSGTNTDEGYAMLVNDVGRKTFALPSHPTLSITTGAENLLSAVKSALAGANANWGMTDANDIPDDLYAKRGFLFKTPDTNTGSVYIGTSAVNAAGDYGIPLGAGESMFIEVTQASTFYLVSSTGTQSVHFLAI
jgi:hypothetical protein